jgi:hypothetical protein
LHIEFSITVFQTVANFIATTWVNLIQPRVVLLSVKQNHHTTTITTTTPD